METDSTWSEGGNAHWRFVGEELIGHLDSGAGFVVTKEKFKDFELNLEFKPDSTINSGVYVRCKVPELSATDCYEINIWDLHPNQEYRTGAVVSRASPLKYVETLNQWNTYRIIGQGHHLRAWVNGEKTVDMVNEDLSGGYIALQAAGSGEIRFRNIIITIPPRQ